MPRRRRFITSGMWGGFTPLSLFGPGDSGFINDYSLTDRMRQLSDGTVAVTADDDPVGWLKSLDPTERIHLQATAGSRPLWKTGGLLRFDGTADNLLTTLAPGAAMSFVSLITFGASGSIRAIIGGATGGTSRCFFCRHTDGRLSLGLGNNANTVAIGGSNLAGLTGIAMATYDGATVNLYWNDPDTPIYTGAQNGTPGATVFRVGATNTAPNIPGNYGNDDHQYDLAITRVLSDTERGKLFDFLSFI